MVDSIITLSPKQGFRSRPITSVIPLVITGVHDWFNAAAKKVSSWVGSQWAFAVAFLIIIIWGITGPLFKFSDTWQLVINTGTTIVTFLMVFLIQNTQNRDARALHLKLDEIIRSIDKARNELIDLEDVTDDQLDRLQKEFEDLRVKGEQGAETVLQALKSERTKRKKR